MFGRTAASSVVDESTNRSVKRLPKQRGHAGKEVMESQEDYLRAMIEGLIQEVLEAEMDEALGAEKGERTAKPASNGLRPRPLLMH